MAGLYGPVHRLVADNGPIGRWRASPAHASVPHEQQRPAQPREGTT
jgi:hypothetical protein